MPQNFFGTPEIEVNLPVAGKRRFMLDTGGYFPLSLNQARIELLLRSGMAAEAGVLHAVDAGGLLKINAYVVRYIEIAGYRFEDLFVTESRVETVGCGVLDCFDTVLDFPRKEMYLTPLETQWPVRLYPDASGLIMCYHDTDLLYVVRMEPDCAAVRSGLKVGDRVLSFDGKSPKDTSMRAMRMKLTEAGTTVKLRILRDGNELDVDLPLSRSYEYPPKWPEKPDDGDAFLKSLEKAGESAKK